MQWASWADFWDMGGRGFFVWSAFGVTAVCIALELGWLRRWGARTRARLARLQQWDEPVGTERP